MVPTILVPLDGSSFAEHALPLALKIACKTDGQVHLVRAHVSVSSYAAGSELVADVELDGQLRGLEQAYLDRTARKLTSPSQVRVTSALPDGPVAEAIAREARVTGAGLIVMTSHGRGPLSRFWLGSVADQLIRQAPAPVLLVRPGAESPDLSATPEIRHVLIALDGGTLAEEVIEPAVALGSRFEARYTLLRVIQPTAEVREWFSDGQAGETTQGMVNHLYALEEQVEAEAKVDLEGVAARLRARSLEVETAVTRNRQAAAGILDYAGAHAVDVIAVETHGRGVLPRLFLGSVADKVLRGARVPVLVQRPSPWPNGKARQERALIQAGGTESDRALVVDPVPELHPGCLHGR